MTLNCRKSCLRNEVVLFYWDVLICCIFIFQIKHWLAIKKDWSAKMCLYRVALFQVWSFCSCNSPEIQVCLLNYRKELGRWVLNKTMTHIQCLFFTVSPEGKAVQGFFVKIIRNSLFTLTFLKDSKLLLWRKLTKIRSRIFMQTWKHLFELLW